MSEIIDKAIEMTNIINKYEELLNANITPYEELRLKLKIEKDFPYAQITKFEKISNKYTYAAYMIKKEEMKKNGYSKVLELFHATGVQNIVSIAKNNLDWRYVSRAKYGRGVSFSGSANYADRYSARQYGGNKAFIVCDVLIGKTSRSSGYWDRTYPDSDTVISNDGNVYVKFDDNTFYPKYAVYYKL